MIDFSSELNAEQLRVVQNGDGPCLVLAGAGSGKTRTITYRVAYLLEKGIKPENILLVTFTNKAAEQMKERVMNLVRKLETRNSKLGDDTVNTPVSSFQFPVSNILPWSGTFHHIGYRILKQYAALLGYGNNFTVLDSDDSESILKLCSKEIKNSGETKRFPSASVLSSIISYSRNAELSLEHVIEERYPQWLQFTGDIQAIAAGYSARKREANAMDFDDLLTNFLLLLNNEKMCAKFATQFNYILVDEYQDTNKIQASLIQKLSSVHKNVLVVGDDAQSIYSFRAADINNILGFEKIYPNAQIFKLETNYRSTEKILDIANNVIANNREQYQKKLHAAISPSAREGAHGGEGVPMPALYPQLDQQSEASFVAKKIQEHLENGISPKEIAVLFRAAYHSQMLEVELVQRGISYDYRGGVRFFERAHIKDILSYLRILNNVADTAAWLRVLMHEEGIGPAAAQKVVEAVRASLSSRARPSQADEGSLSQSNGDNGNGEPEISHSVRNDNLNNIGDVGRSVLGAKAQTGWNNFIQIWNVILAVPERSPSELIEAIVGSAYKDYLEGEYIDFRDRLSDIKQLALFAERYDELNTFLAEMTLQESFRAIANETSPTALSSAEERDIVATSPSQRRGQGEVLSSNEKIVLSTIHQAKGLEWSVVFIINLASGAFPSDRALKEDNGLEEERRLLYVAITRAKKYLYLTYPMSGGSYGDFLSGPSLFLNEINPELIEDHSLLSTDASVFNDPSEGIQYVSEDAPRLTKKPKPGSFLVDLEDL